MRVAVAQLDPRLGEKERNRELYGALVEETVAIET